MVMICQCCDYHEKESDGTAHPDGEGLKKAGLVTSSRINRSQRDEYQYPASQYHKHYCLIHFFEVLDKKSILLYNYIK
jgi:hypothetical protein